MKNNFFVKTIKYLLFTFLLITCKFIVFGSTVSAGEMTMHSVYVGRGDAIIIESKGHFMLVDSGTEDASGLLTSYLNKLNIPEDKIDYVISTHPDGDHVGSFPSVFSDYSIGQVFYSPCAKESSEYYNFVNSVKEEGCPYRNPREGETWKLGDATVKVIYDGSKGSTYNECSIVLKVTCDGKSILLTGDLPSTMEDSLMREGYDFKADVLKVGHHGAAASTCAKFLDTVKPQYAVISCDKSKNTVLPKPTTLMRLARRFIKTYRTTDGDVILNFRDGKITTENKENNGYISIKKAKVTLSNNVFYATGKDIRPTVTISVNGVTVPSNQYKVSYSSNRYTGIGKVKVTGTEAKYVSVCYGTFLILPQKESIKGSVVDYSGIKLKWAAQSQATGYEIKYSTDKDLKKDVKTLTYRTPKKTEKILTGLKTNTKYYFKVRAYKCNIGNGKWSKRISVKTSTPPIPSKIKIKSYKLTNKNYIKLVWKKQSSSHKAGYRIQFSTDRKFIKKKTNTIRYKKTTKTYRTLRKLKKNTTYYIRIQGYNKYGNGKWSKVIQVKTKKNADNKAAKKVVKKSNKK